MKSLFPVALSLLFPLILPFSEILPKAAAFSIEQPENGSTHPSNKTVSVVLDLGAATGITKVQFYWYEEQEDMLKAFVEEKLAGVETAPPFGADLQPPQAATGLYRLLAVAEQENRQADDEEWAVFDEVLLHIQPHGSLEEIDFQTDKPLKFGRASAVRVYDQLDFLGKTIDLPVVGRFSDGALRSIRTAAAGTTYHVDDESVITINENGRLRLVGNGATTVTVKNAGVEKKLDVLVEVNTEPNQPPVADPGPTRTVYSGETVVLNGLKSYDPEGGSLQYSWAQIRGSKIALLDPDSAKASFLAPFVAEPRLFRFTLRVTDVQGADSVPAVVDIMVEP
jgi:hypothetical protein